uniref:Tetratricopeptide repeat protein n=1 Tax=Solibacter usitatus (strain Ellin6076) TaxID=234267 RepID=Q028Y2_SOLUE
MLTGIAVGTVVSTWMVPMFAQRSGHSTAVSVTNGRETPSDSSSEPPSPTEILITQFEKREQQLLADEKDRLNALDSNSRVLMTVAGVFAIFLGLGAWKTLDDQRRSAAENLDLQMTNFSDRFTHEIEEHRHQSERAMQELRDMREEIRRDFPMFGRMTQNFTRVLTQLQVTCQYLEAMDETYEKLTWDQRESILFLEHAVADSLLLDTRDFNLELSEIYRLLGLFYGSRYSVAKAGHPEAGQADLDRARFYFDRAIQLNPKNYFAYSHAGYFTLYFEDPTLAARSREYFRQAAVVGPTKQNPLINLALLALNTFKEPEESLRCVDAAQGRTEWEKKGSPPKPQHCYYIRACALAAIAQKTEDGGTKHKLLAAALTQLENASQAADEWIRACFNGDQQTPPDRTATFDEIRADPTLLPQFEKVNSALAAGNSL